jgi:hypothetical protein
MASPEALRVLRELQAKPENKVGPRHAEEKPSRSHSYVFWGRANPSGLAACAAVAGVDEDQPRGQPSCAAPIPGSALHARLLDPSSSAAGRRQLQLGDGAGAARPRADHRVAGPGRCSCAPEQGPGLLLPRRLFYVGLRCPPPARRCAWTVRPRTPSGRRSRMAPSCASSARASTAAWASTSRL